MRYKNRPDLGDFKLNFPPPLSAEQIMMIHRMPQSTFCPRCQGDGVIFTPTTVDLGDFKMQGMLAEACVLCDATGRISYLCAN